MTREDIMTREEAIEYLVGMDIESLADGLNEAVTMAIEALSADEYVPNKACFDCMERATGMCKGTIQEQSWCPYVAKINTEPNEIEHDGCSGCRLEPFKEDAEACKDLIKQDGQDYLDERDIPLLDMAIESLQTDSEWIPFKKRPMTDEEREEYPDWAYIFDCPLPEDEEEILLTNGVHVWTDTFINDGECYLDGGDDIDDDMAWMPLPKPYRKDGEEE